MKTTTEKGFRVKIRDACKGLGTYRQEFEGPIGRLAEYYARASAAKDQWEKAGKPLFVTMTNKSGGEYFGQHPLIKEIDNCAEHISQLEKALGLTPEAINKINQAALGKKPLEENDPLAAALGQLRVV